MATKKKVTKEKSMVKISTDSVTKVKIAIAATKVSIGEFYENAAEKELKLQSKK